MSLDKSVLRRRLIRLVYLLPAITWLWVLISAFIPHLYFVYEDVAQETLSIVHLMGNSWKECIGFFDGTANGTTADLMFSYFVVFTVVLTWIAVVWCGLFALTCAGLSSYALGRSPTDKYTNRAKKIFHLVCPHRVCYGLFSAFLPFIAFYPQILILLYKQQLGMSVQLFAFGWMDWIPATLLSLLSLGGFLGTLAWQDVTHLDMFRLYKGKSSTRQAQN